MLLTVDKAGRTASRKGAAYVNCCNFIRDQKFVVDFCLDPPPRKVSKQSHVLGKIN